METIKNGEVVAGINVIKTDYKVKRPVFEDVKIERPIWTDRQVERPVGIEKVIISLADDITKKVLELVDERIGKAIDARLRTVEVPEIVYREKFKDVTIDRVSYNDVVVDRAKLVDKEIINPVLVDREIINPVVSDVEVVNAIVKDKVVVNAILEDVVVQKPKYIEKTIHAIHVKYVDPKGNIESEEDLK